MVGERAGNTILKCGGRAPSIQVGNILIKIYFSHVLSEWPVGKFTKYSK